MEFCHSRPVCLVGDAHIPKMISNPRCLAVIRTIPIKGGTQLLLDFFSMAHEELKSRFVLSRVAFSHVEINSGIVIISCAIDMESADPKVAVC